MSPPIRVRYDSTTIYTYQDYHLQNLSLELLPSVQGLADLAYLIIIASQLF